MKGQDDVEPFAWAYEASETGHSFLSIDEGECQRVAEKMPFKSYSIFPLYRHHRPMSDAEILAVAATLLDGTRFDIGAACCRAAAKEARP